MKINWRRVAILGAIILVVWLVTQAIPDPNPCDEHHLTSAAECLHKRYEERKP